MRIGTLMLLLLLFSCARFERRDFKLQRDARISLPGMKVAVHQESLKRHYWAFAELLTNKKTVTVPNKSVVTTASIANVHYRPDAAEDTEEIVLQQLERYLFPEASDARSAHGTLEVRFAGKQERRRSTWMIPSILTLSAINILGVPFEGRDAKVGLELIVLDSSGKTMGRYSGIGQSTEWAAYYWGYSPAGSHLYRACLASATLAALNDALDKLAKDAPRLRDRISATVGAGIELRQGQRR